MENLKKYGLVPVIHEIVEKGTPFLGICLGLQLLFESSDETPGVERSWNPEGENPAHPAKSGTEDSAYGLEFPAYSEQRKII